MAFSRDDLGGAVERLVPKGSAGYNAGNNLGLAVSAAKVKKPKSTRPERDVVETPVPARRPGQEFLGPRMSKAEQARVIVEAESSWRKNARDREWASRQPGTFKSDAREEYAVAPRERQLGRVGPAISAGVPVPSFDLGAVADVVNSTTSTISKPAVLGMKAVGVPLEAAHTAATAAVMQIQDADHTLLSDQWFGDLLDSDAWTKHLNIAWGGAADANRPSGWGPVPGWGVATDIWDRMETANPGVSFGQAISYGFDDKDRKYGVVDWSNPQEVAQARKDIVEGNAPGWSGGIDAGFSLVGDPINIVGVGIVSQTLKAFTRPIRSAEDVARALKDADAGVAYIKSGGKLGKDTREGRFVEYTSRADVNGVTLSNRAEFRADHTPHGGLLSSLMGESTDIDRSLKIYKAALGDDATLAELAQESALTADKINRWARWENGGGNPDAFQVTPDGKMETPWGIADDAAHARALADELVAHDAYLNKLYAATGTRVTEEGVVQGVPVLARRAVGGPMEAARKTGARARASRLGVVSAQPTKYDNVYHFLTWPTRDHPGGWTDINRADAHVQFATEMHGIPLTPELRNNYYRQFIGVQGNFSSMRNVVAASEREGVRTLASRHGWTVEQADALYNQLDGARQSLLKTLTEHGAARDADGQIYAFAKMDDNLKSMLPNRVPILDFKVLEREMKRMGSPTLRPGDAPIAVTIGKYTDGALDIADGLTDMWKISVLLRLGYPMRNVTDSAGRSLVRSNILQNGADLIAAGPNAVRNANRRAKRAADRVLFSRAEQLGAQDADMVAKSRIVDYTDQDFSTTLDATIVGREAEDAFAPTVSDLRPPTASPGAQMTAEKFNAEFPNGLNGRYRSVASMVSGRDGYLATRPGPNPKSYPLTKVHMDPAKGKAWGQWYGSAKSVRSRPIREYRELRAANPDWTPDQIAAAMPTKNSTRLDRETLVAYDHFARETADQYRYLTEELGVQVEVVRYDPYDNVAEMVADVRDNNRIKVFSTESTGGHPFLSNEENDMFRAVHDAFAHAGVGRSFDRHGEEAAFVAHARMYSDEAVRALATETRGQNTYLAYVNKGEFGPQKVVLAPEDMASREPARIAAKREHREHVEEAVDRGDQVSAEVLADYPDLKLKSERGLRNRRRAWNRAVPVSDNELQTMWSRMRTKDGTGWDDQNGGFTFDPTNGEFTPTGISVSRRGTESMSTEKVENGGIVLTEATTPADLRAMITPGMLTAVQQQPQLKIGGWVQTSKEDGLTRAFVELADVLGVDDHLRAVQLAKSRGQWGVYDLDRQKYIPIASETGASRADAITRAGWLRLNAENEYQAAKLAYVEEHGRAAFEKLMKQAKVGRVKLGGRIDELDGQIKALSKQIDEGAAAQVPDRIALGELAAQRNRLTTTRAVLRDAATVRQVRRKRDLGTDRANRARAGDNSFPAGPKDAPYKIAGALDKNDPMSSVFMDLSSSASTYDQYVYSRAAQNLSGLEATETAKWLTPDSRGYYEEWSDSFGRHFNNSPTARRLMMGESPEDVAQWLRTSPEGRAELRQLRRDLTDVDDHVEAVGQMLDKYTMGDPELTIAARNGVVTPQMLREWYPVGTPELPVVWGRELEINLKKQTALKVVRTTGAKLMKVLGTMPEDAMARHPYYARKFKGQMKREVEFADARIQRKLEARFGSGSRRELEAKAEAAGWTKDQYRLTSDDLMVFRRSSHEKALGDLRSTMYTHLRKGNTEYAIRFMSPFFAAFANSMWFWGKALATNPLVGATAAKIWNAPQKAGWVVDEDGNTVAPYTDAPGSGTFIVLPMTQKMINALPSEGMRAGASALSTMLIPKDSLNMILQGENPWFPGASPWVTVPTSEWIKHQAPEVEKSMLLLLGPGGVSDLPAWKQVLPTAVQKMLATGDDQSQLWSNTYNEIAKSEYVKFQTGDRPGEASPEELVQKTNGLLAARAVFSLTLPWAARMQSPYAFYDHEWNRMLKDNGGNTNEAQTEFLEKYGEDYFAMTISTSKSKTGMEPSVEAWKNAKKHSALISDVGVDDPAIIGLLTNEDGEFSNAVYRWSYGTPISQGSKTMFRNGREPGDAVNEVERKLGWMKWTGFQNEVADELAARGLNSIRQKDAADLLAAQNFFKGELTTEYPAWRSDMDEFDSGKSKKRLLSFNKVLSDEKFMKAHADDPVWKSVAAYLNFVDEVKAELKARIEEDSDWGKSLDSNDNEDLQIAMDYYSNELREQTSGFDEVFDRYLRPIKVEVN